MRKMYIINFLTDYSFEDLAKSFFVLNLWLPNVSSHIKSQFLYVTLEAIFDQLPEENKINDYSCFREFSEKLIQFIPSFPTMEDYLPENDWGEIKYYLNEKFFSVFYGGDLSNTYDFYYSFEVIHKGFDDFYRNKIGRLPFDELEFCVNLQDKIINGIDSNIQDKKEVKLRGFEVPSEKFWETCVQFLDSFNPQELSTDDIIKEYTKDIAEASPSPMISEKEFVSRAHDGKNCCYFFLKKDDKYYPILPRKYFSVLFDKWGKILSDNYANIEKEVDPQGVTIGVQIYHFLRNRAKEANLFFISSALQPDLKPHKTIFTTAFQSKSKLILIHVLPLKSGHTNQQSNLNELVPELIEAQQLLSTVPTKLGLHGKGHMIQFESNENTNPSLEPLILIVIPHVTTDFRAFYQPNNLPGQVIGLDQLLGILDEIENLDELSDYFDYFEQNRNSFELVSYLDIFGSFRDSNSVLVAGASIPDFIMLDPHWGSEYRYRSLSKFWKLFPQENFFGHPRSWSIKEDYPSKGTLIIDSRNFFGYVYCFSLSLTTFFINSAVDSLTFEQGEVSDFMMRSLVDSIILYKEQIQQLSFAKTSKKLQILFFPTSLVKSNPKFSYLLHLIPSETIWAMDAKRLNRKYYGIRIVFDDEKSIEILKDAQDRSVQIDLLIDVLRKINDHFNDHEFTKVESELSKEKTKKNRFRFFTVQKKVSFPELSKYAFPEMKEFKLADKKIAEIAKVNNISEGVYEAKEAKDKVDSLKSGLLEYLNSEVKLFDLERVITVLIGNIDALTDEYERKKTQVENSIDQEVDYKRDISFGGSKQEFLNLNKTYQYLIEKFVQLQPSGKKLFSNLDLSTLLALVSRLLSLYTTSDFLHHGIYPAKMEITDDFLAEIDYGADINKMQTEWAQEQAQIALGIIGNKEDRVSIPFNIASYIEEIDENSKKDLGFRWTDMINLQHVLALWAAYDNTTEKTYYSATAEEIRETCVKGIDEFDSSKTETILKFLTLDPNKILIIENDNRIPPDLPVWEYRKRTTRYSLRCLIKIDDHYLWGAHSIDRSGKVWISVVNSHKLPADIKAPLMESTLKKGHDAIQIALQNKIKEVVLRYTPYVKTEIFPHKILVSDDIGDIDVFALVKEKNILLNVESKIIDVAFCNKDIKRISEKVFGRVRKTDGSFEEGYLQMVEKRDRLLNAKGRGMAEKYWGTLSSQPKIISIFVTQVSYWWTKYPPIQTDIYFIEIDLLDDFLKKLLKEN